MADEPYPPAGSVALVTGAGGGIGAAVAEALEGSAAGSCARAGA